MIQQVISNQNGVFSVFCAWRVEERGKQLQSANIFALQTISVAVDGKTQLSRWRTYSNVAPFTCHGVGGEQSTKACVRRHDMASGAPPTPRRSALAWRIHHVSSRAIGPSSRIQPEAIRRDYLLTCYQQLLVDKTKLTVAVANKLYIC